jgi:hypothetical protein
MARVQLDTVSCLFDCAVRVPRRHEGEAELDACLRVRGSTSTAAHIGQKTLHRLFRRIGPGVEEFSDAHFGELPTGLSEGRFQSDAAP